MKGTFQQVSRILKVNLEELRKKAGGRTGQMERYLAELEMHVGELKTAYLEELGLETRCFEKYLDLRGAAAAYAKKAEKAVKSRKEELAREALRRKLVLDDLAKDALRQHDNQHKHVTLLRALLQQLEERYAEIRQMQIDMEARKKLHVLNAKYGRRADMDELEQDMEDEIFKEKSKDELEKELRGNFNPGEEKQGRDSVDERVEKEFVKLQEAEKREVG